MTDNKELTWEAQIEQFKSQLSGPDRAICFQCKESIVSWNGDYLLCAKKGIILKPLKIA